MDIIFFKSYPIFHVPNSNLSNIVTEICTCFSRVSVDIQTNKYLVAKVNN